MNAGIFGFTAFNGPSAATPMIRGPRAADVEGNIAEVDVVGNLAAVDVVENLGVVEVESIIFEVEVEP